MRASWPTVVLAASGATLATAALATAASLGVVPTRLTTQSAASSVAATVCTLETSSADTYVDGGSLLSNFGTSPDLQVRSSLVGNRRSFVRFDLSGCAIPATARVTNATVSLLLSQAPSSNRTYEVRRVTASWVETTVTWLSQPGVAGSVTATVSTGTTSGVTLNWAVTADAQSIVAGSVANNGWRVADNSENAVVAVSGVLGARERASIGERPKLVLTYYP